MGIFFPPQEQTEKENITLPSLWAVALTTATPPPATPTPFSQLACPELLI